MKDNILRLYEYFTRSHIISTDSRSIPVGSVFFALKGDNFNGNQYARKALDSGACLAVIDEDAYKENDDFFLVDNVLETLQALALHHRNMFNIPFIGITGTNGKTTTKELLYATLSVKFNCLATQGNLNNHIGVPLTLLSVKSEHEVAIVEMGANHLGEIDFLCGLVNPTHGIITNIGKAHLEGFGSHENIVATKTALYKHVDKNKGCVFVNADDALLMSESEKMNRYTYALHNEADQVAKVLPSDAFLDFSWKNHDVQTALFGSYNIYNVMAALTTGAYFGADIRKMSDAIAAYIPKNNRSQIIKSPYNTLVLDAYNANPTSMAAALNSFAKLESPQKALILGDMLELGDNSSEEHAIIVHLIKDLNFENVFLVGREFFRTTGHNYPIFENAAALAEYLKMKPLRNNYILIKGSRGIRLESITQYL